MGYMTEENTLSENKRVCECGCGEIVSGFTHSTPPKPVRYKKGHMPKSVDHWHWNGGKRISTNGYVEIYMPSHPCASKQGYVLEHRLVMEKEIDRQLSSTEHVHHINRNKQDNRKENLKLMHSNAEHGRLHKPLMDMSGRICSNCGSLKTHDRHWYTINSALYCRKCYRDCKRSEYEEHGGKTFCSCGCGSQIPRINRRGEPASFKHGHNQRNRRIIKKDSI